LSAALFVFILGTVFLVRLSPPHLNQERHQTDVRHWLHVALPFFAISGASAIFRQVATLSLGAFGTAQDTGVFAAMTRISEFAALGTVMAGAVAAPMIVDLHHRGDREGLQRLVRLATNVSFGFSLLVSVVFMVLGEYVMQAFGKQFTTGKEVLVVLLLGQIGSGYAGIVGYVMSMTDYAKQHAWLNWVSALLNVGVCLMLVPRFGALGAAASSVLIIFVQMLLMLFIIKRRLGVWCGAH
jgi:O-antigen/teichoic acid export membrane protein